jgi:hypothetical protein
VSWDVGLLEEGSLMTYWLVELTSSILLKSSFVRSNWILFASCKNVISSMRCFGIAIIFVSVGFVLGLLFCLVVVDLVLVILSFSEKYSVKISEMIGSVLSFKVLSE